MLTTLSFIFAACLTAVHLGSKYMAFLHYVPRSRLLSVAGGISVAYVFIHVLPELGKHQQKVEKSSLSAGIDFLDNHVYLVAMAGLAIFYGLEHLARKHRQKKDDRSHSSVFWIHIASFSAYNALIGYLLIRGESESITGMALYFLALAVHFVSNDHGLRQSHSEIYDKYGRWLLAVSILAGWAAGYFFEVSETAIAILFALLAGSIILNVLKEELPEDRQSNFGAFAAGLAAYSLLLLVI